MEALSAGTCMVAYPSGGIPELIRGGHSGLLTDAALPEALARAIQSLVRKPELRVALAENGRTDWETRFTLEKVSTRGLRSASCGGGFRSARRHRIRSTPPAAEFGGDAALSSPENWR